MLVVELTYLFTISYTYASFLEIARMYGMDSFPCDKLRPFFHRDFHCPPPCCPLG